VLSEDRQEIVLRMTGDEASIEIPLTLPNARKLVNGLTEILRIAEDERQRRGRH
jgi:hypothetical protein